MNINDLLTTLGANLKSWHVASIVIALLSLVEVSPIKIDPWSAIGRFIGKLINADVIKRLDNMDKRMTEDRDRMDAHIRQDDERNADLHRYRILRFNTEIMRKQPHTEEEFNEILYNISCYEQYCYDHPEYKNNRAVMAIRNIERVNEEHMKNGTYLDYVQDAPHTEDDG